MDENGVQGAAEGADLRRQDEEGCGHLSRVGIVFVHRCARERVTYEPKLGTWSL